jgi:hypothetical protein
MEYFAWIGISGAGIPHDSADRAGREAARNGCGREAIYCASWVCKSTTLAASQAHADHPRVTNKQCFPFGLVRGLAAPIAPASITRNRQWLAVA